MWAGYFRALETPHWQLPKTTTVTGILGDWLPASEGPGASMNVTQLARLLDTSWLSDERLFVAVWRLRTAATRARCQLDSTRLAAALALYQVREGKTAELLDDLKPRYLAELPIDPYSGQPFQYRLSKGEKIELLRADGGQIDMLHVQAGDVVLWSTGPDGMDDSARQDGSRLLHQNPHVSRGGYDLIVVLPKERFGLRK